MYVLELLLTISEKACNDETEVLEERRLEDPAVHAYDLVADGDDAHVLFLSPALVEDRLFPVLVLYDHASEVAVSGLCMAADARYITAVQVDRCPVHVSSGALAVENGRLNIILV